MNASASADIEQWNCFPTGQQHFIDTAARPAGYGIFLDRDQV